MQNCRNNNPYMRRANCGCGNNNNSCNSNSCMANNDGRNPSMSAPVYRERSGCAEFHQDACDTCIKMRKDPLSQFPLAMAYVPWQSWRHIYEAGKGFHRGTIFEELDLPFKGKGGCNA